MVKEIIAFKYFNFSVFLHFIGRLLYKTFIPIILLTNGYSIEEIFVYLIACSFITIIFLIFSVKTLAKQNVLFFYILAIISEIILIFLLIPGKVDYLIFILIILTESLYYSYYYISYYSIIAHYTSKKQISNNLGNLRIFSKLANIFAPILGAILLIINKQLFIIVAILFLLFSIIPLFKIIKTDINGLDLPKVRLQDIKYELFSCGIRSGIEFVVFTLWAIYIFVAGFSLIYVGLVPAIGALAVILLLYTIKKRLATIRFRTLTKLIAIVGIIIISIYRFYFPEQIIFTNFMISLCFTAFSLSINADYFEKIKNHQTYYSAVLLQSICFSSWVILGLIAFFIGLKYSILLPIILAFIWFLFSLNKIFKVFSNFSKDRI